MRKAVQETLTDRHGALETPPNCRKFRLEHDPVSFVRIMRRIV